MVQCFILNEESNDYWHSITTLYPFNNVGFGIDDFIFTKTYRKEKKTYDTKTIYINREKLRNLIENPNLKLYEKCINNKSERNLLNIKIK